MIPGRAGHPVAPGEEGALAGANDVALDECREGYVAADLAAQDAAQMVRELRLRRRAGQHTLVQDLLPKFPGQDVAQEILLETIELLWNINHILFILAV